MRKNLLAVAVLALGLSPIPALAAGYTVPNFSPRDLGMASSLVAAQDDAGAVFGNPAALGHIEGLSLNLGFGLIDIRSAWKDPTGTQSPGSSQMDVNLVPPPALYASYGLRLPNDWGLGFGLGFTVPFGGNVFWPLNWPGRFDIQTVERRIYGTYASVGLEPLKWLRIGGGFVWYRGTEHLRQATNFLAYESFAELGAAGNAYSYALAAEIQPLQSLRLGIDYKHQGAMTLTGKAHFDNPPGSLASNTLDQDVTHQLTMPNVVNAGVAWQALPILLVTGTFTWQRYIVYDKDAFIGSAGAAVVVPRNYHNGQVYRFGAEVGPIGAFKFRAGFLRDIAPTPREWMSPSIPDADTWAGSVGVSWSPMENLEINAAYFHAWFDELTTYPPNNVFPGTYNTWANIASIGVVYRWLPK